MHCLSEGGANDTQVGGDLSRKASLPALKIFRDRPAAFPDKSGPTESVQTGGIVYVLNRDQRRQFTVQLIVVSQVQLDQAA